MKTLVKWPRATRASSERGYSGYRNVCDRRLVLLVYSIFMTSILYKSIQSAQMSLRWQLRCIEHLQRRLCILYSISSWAILFSVLSTLPEAGL